MLGKVIKRPSQIPFLVDDLRIFVLVEPDRDSDLVTLENIIAQVGEVEDSSKRIHRRELEVGDDVSPGYDVSLGDLNFEKALSGAGKYFGGRDVLDRDQQQGSTGFFKLMGHGSANVLDLDLAQCGSHLIKSTFLLERR